MAIKLYSVRCPDCGANLPIEEGRKQVFCSYCGTKVIINNENEYIYRTVDEAGIKQAETDRIVELKRLEMAEKQRIAKEKHRKFKVILTIILGIAGVGCMGLAYMSDLYGLMMPGMICLIIMMCMWGNNDKKKDDDD